MLRIATSDLLAAVMVALAAFAAAQMLRTAGMLERVDLAIDDRLLAPTRPPAAADGFLVILAREERALRSDEAVATLLEKLSAHGPLAIGIDQYRDHPAPPSDHIYWGIAGCGDLLKDRDGVVRRALVHKNLDGGTCDSLAFQLAHAARAKGENWTFTTDKPPRLVAGAARMRPVDPGDGPYASIDATGFQVAIPTAAGMPKFDAASFDDVLQGKVDPSRIRDRVILIGSEAGRLRVHALIAAHFLDVARQRSDPLLLLPGAATAIATGALASLMAVIACSRRKTWRVLAYGATIVAFYLLGAYALASGAILFAPAAPAVAMAIALVAGIARHAWLKIR